MKTAVSLPDELFEEAEDLAQRLRTSRSQLYRLALEDFLRRHNPDRVRDAMNAALERVGEKDTDFANAAASHILRKSEW